MDRAAARPRWPTWRSARGEGWPPTRRPTAPWFAGRERITAELVARVAVDRALLLVGASGSGKSSLLRAGLLASLAAGALPGSASWVRIVLRPGAASDARADQGGAVRRRGHRARTAWPTCCPGPWTGGVGRSGSCWWSTSSRSAGRSAPTPGNATHSSTRWPRWPRRRCRCRSCSPCAPTMPAASPGTRGSPARWPGRRCSSGRWGRASCAGRSRDRPRAPGSAWTPDWPMPWSPTRWPNPVASHCCRRR